MLDEFQTANLKFSKARDLEEVRWEAQTKPWYTVNSDATIFANNNSTGVGVIIRDHDGNVEAAISKSLPLPLGPLEAEAKALEESLLFAWDVGVQDVLFECDCKVVCDAMTGCSDPPSVMGKIRHCFCEANHHSSINVMIGLPTRGALQPQEFVCFDEPPPDIILCIMTLLACTLRDNAQVFLLWINISVLFYHKYIYIYIMILVIILLSYSTKSIVFDYLSRYHGYISLKKKILIK